MLFLYIYNIDRSNLHGEAPGLDRPGRTCMAYCLLSKAPQSSEECFSTALEAHLANLDPNMRITTSVVSVPWPNSVSMAVGTNSFPTENTAGGLNQVTGSYELVRLELDLRDQARDEIRKRLHHEMQVPRHRDICAEGCWMVARCSKGHGHRLGTWSNLEMWC